MSDGGEGLLDAVGGTRHVTTVAGPLGAPVEAEWRMLEGAGATAAPTAVVEMSRAAGRALLPKPRGEDPVRAGTAGVGQLLLAARDAGARRIVIGCGGSATTDGGEGAFDAVGSPVVLPGVELVVASDVTTAFTDAARVFGPQKGATPAQVEVLGRRLVDVAATLPARDRRRRHHRARCRRGRGPGRRAGRARRAHRAGVRLRRRSRRAGRTPGARRPGRHGRGPPRSALLRGQGPRRRARLAQARARRGRPLPVLCIAGGADRALLAAPPAGLEVVSLTARFGRAKARSETVALIGQVTAESLTRFCP